jgi:ribosomal-protein-alanine N-acetyltransferase
MTDRPLLQFRDFCAADLPIMAQAMGDARVTQFYGLETEQTDAQAIAREQLAWYQGQAAEGTGWWQAICAEGRVLGAVGIYDRDDDGDSAELGYWLLPSQWGRGVMRLALRQWLPQAFEKLELHSVVAYVEPGNLASARLLAAAGFAHEGLLRECTRRGERYASLHRFSLLVHEL